MNIIYMGTPEFAVPTLESLHERGHNISLVITQEDKPKGRGKKLQYTPVKEKALALGLEVYQPNNVNCIDSIEIIRKLEPDFIIVVAYGQILKKEILSIPKYGCFNVHASLLPKYRGAAPINWSIINGDTKTGISIMKMDQGLDTGDIVLMDSIEIDKLDDYITVHDKLSLLGGKLILEAMDLVIDEKTKFIKQDDTQSNYAPMIYKETGHIDWALPGIDICNLVRGLKPWPIAYTIYNDEVVKIHKTKFIPTEKSCNYGEIIKANKEGIFVSVLDGNIIIEELQFPGKKVLTAAQYLAGNQIVIGTVLK